jgi:hypothetical protein
VSVLDSLDLRSLSVATAVATLPLGALSLLALRLAPEVRGPRQWTRASGCVVGSLRLYVVGGGLAPVSFFADLLGVLALVLILEGLRAGRPGAPAGRRLSAVLVTVMVAFLIWFSAVDPRPERRAGAASAAMAISALRICSELRRQAERPPLLRLGGAAAFAAMGLGLAYRVAAVSLAGPKPAASLARGNAAVLPMLLTLFAVVGGCAAAFALAAHEVLVRYREAHRDLERLAREDALTGLANRRTLIEHLAQQCADARREARPLALVLLDVDGFKACNDRLGHAGGDAVLVALAACLRRALR